MITDVCCDVISVFSVSLMYVQYILDHGGGIVLSNGCIRCKLCSVTFHVMINEQVSPVSISSH